MAGRSYASGKKVLVLDGTPTGALVSVRGGDTVGEVLKHSSGGSPFIRKGMGRIRYQPLTLEVDLGMIPAVYEWIASAFTAQPARPDLTVISCDINYVPQSARRYRRCRITEIIVPRLDAKSKDAATLLVTVVANRADDVPTPGTATPPRSTRTGKWTSANFRLEIVDVDHTAVVAVGSFSVRRPGSGKIDLPNLELVLAEARAKTWVSWHRSLVVTGNQQDERVGTLHILNPALTTTLARFELGGLGLFALGEERPTGRDAVQYLRAQLYCSQMSFQSP